MRSYMSNNIKILVAAHKADSAIRQDDIYTPIHVGKALHIDVDLGFQGDNTGDNISEKNVSYCELTAIYWAWKNLKDIDILGLAHYRRYLKFNIEKNKEFLKKGGIILPRPFHCRYDNYTNLALLLNQESAILTINALLNRLPDSSKAVREYFWRSNKYSVFNMFVMRWKEFDEYCSFLFPLLSHLEHTLKHEEYNRLKRNIGYIAEALLGFWIRYKKLKVKYVPVEDLSTSIHADTLKTKLREFQRDFGFNITYLPWKQNITYYPAALGALKSQGYDINEKQS